jgi:hypothetical protein
MFNATERESATVTEKKGCFSMQWHAERWQGAGAEARMVQIWILDDECHGLVVAGELWRRHCGVSASLLLEEAETCFVLPLREAVAHFARRNARSTDAKKMGCSDNGNAHTTSIDMAADFRVGFLPPSR